MIRNKGRKKLAMLIAAVLISSTVMGCASKTVTNTSTNTSVVQTINSTVLGKVTSIDGSKITIALGKESTSNTSSSGTTSSKSNTSTSTTQNQSSSSQNTQTKDSSQKSSTSTTQSASTNKGTPPSKPDGKTPSGNPPSGTPPTGSTSGKASTGTAPSGTPPTGGSGSQGGTSATTFTLTGEKKTIDITDESVITVQKGTKTLSGGLADITIGETVSVTYDNSGKISKLLVKSGNSSYTGGAQTGSLTLSGSYSAKGETKTSSNEKISSTKSDQAAVLASSDGKVTISSATITKSGDTASDDESNFYGVNSGVVSEGASNITISDSTINTNSQGSNGIFSTGDGSVVNVSNVTINTTKDSSRGLDATYNGTIIAKNTNVTTAGTHCAAVANDRGEGTIHLTGGTMTTSGTDSPGIYSTGNITAKGTTFKATGSEAAVVEGKNSITLNDCNVSGAKKNGVMLYQSFSGDSGVGTSYFNMTGGTLTALDGAMFYITNTDAQINLKGATLKTSSGTLINAAAGRWGNSGSNGGNVTLNANSQALEGNVICDKISKVALNLTNSSSLKGTINSAKTAKSVAVSLDKSSSWTVTGTSYVTALTDSDTGLSNIKDNGNTIYYDSSNSTNSWLNGKTITLSGGGTLKPMK